MIKRLLIYCGLLTGCTFNTAHTQAQVLTLKEAVKIALNDYPLLKAKYNYTRSANALVKETRSEYLPDLSLSLQQDYGTVNGLNGPVYGFNGLSVASSGPALSKQNWNAAFGSLYLANINWSFFSFGRVQEKINVSRRVMEQNQADLEQEMFQHQVRVAAAYLNLLAAKQLTLSQQKNLERATTIKNVVVARAKNGLNAGVDSSLANAEVSNAKILLTNAIDYEQEQTAQLAQLLAMPVHDFVLDTLFISRIPSSVTSQPVIQLQEHPLLKYYNARIKASNEQAKYYHTFNYPSFSAFGVIQGRGSGFPNTYSPQNLNDYNSGYGNGTGIARSNYLVGVGMYWNLTSPLRINHQVMAQRLNATALGNEYELASQKLQAQLALADSKIKNAMTNYYEAPIQVKAASDAYIQKTALYKTGLSNIVDLTQTLYTLNRAETNRDIAYNNVWQALLLKAASSGDFSLFINEF